MFVLPFVGWRRNGVISQVCLLVFFHGLGQRCVDAFFSLLRHSHIYSSSCFQLPSSFSLASCFYLSSQLLPSCFPFNSYTWGGVQSILWSHNMKQLKTHKEYNMCEVNGTLALFHVILKLNSHFTVIKLSTSSKVNVLIKFIELPKRTHLQFQSYL